MTRSRPVQQVPVEGATRFVVSIGDHVKVLWGGIDRKYGTRRTTTGHVVRLMSDGKMRLDRGDLQPCNSHVADIVELNNEVITWET